MELKFTLPWPPSVNTYYRRSRGRWHISTAGQKFKEAVVAVVWRTIGGKPSRHTGLVELDIALFPPDERKRDLDNHDGKAIFDSLVAAGLFVNDSQVVRRTGTMHQPIGKPGRCEVTISTLEETP